MKTKGSKIQPKAEEIKKHSITGNTTKYDEEKHIGLLVDVFIEGNDIAAFCSEALISKPTFHNWRKKHKKFKDCYDIMINFAECIWEKMPLMQETKDINYHYWFMVMKNRFGYGKTRFEVPEDKSPLDIIDTILVALGNGELTIQEAAQLASLAREKANITATTPRIDTSIYAISTPEERQKMIGMMQQVIDAQEAK